MRHNPDPTLTADQQAREKKVEKLSGRTSTIVFCITTFSVIGIGTFLFKILPEEFPNLLEPVAEDMIFKGLTDSILESPIAWSVLLGFGLGAISFLIAGAVATDLLCSKYKVGNYLERDTVSDPIIPLGSDQSSSSDLGI